MTETRGEPRLRAPASAGIELRLESVGVRFGDRQVLREVDLVLRERRIGIIGLNGSGKSTLARLFNGLALPDTGRVLVNGLDTRHDAAAVRRAVGFVFTDPDAQIVMPTPVEDVAFSLRRKGWQPRQRQARAEAALARFGLADRADAPAHLLSGGEKQLLALASVLVTEPDLVILDEPTTLLDLRNARRVTDLIAHLEPAVVMVTHHLDALEGFDRVLVVHDGEVHTDADPATAVAAYRRLALAPEHPQDGAPR